MTFLSTGFELHAYPPDVTSEPDSTRGSILYVHTSRTFLRLVFDRLARRPEFSKHTVTASEARIDCKVTTEIIRQVD